MTGVEGFEVPACCQVSGGSWPLAYSHPLSLGKAAELVLGDAAGDGT
jgi:hypothetical protein